MSAWLAQLPDGATAQLAPSGCYALTDSIVVPDRTNLTIDGNGATTKLVSDVTGPYSAAFANLSVWRIQAGSNITLENLTVRGDDPYAGSTFYANDRGPECSGGGDLEWQHGIAFDGTNGGHLVHVNVDHVCGDFVEADTDARVLDPGTGQPLYDQHFARNITIDGGSFTFAGRMGFGLVNVQGFALRNANISYVNEAAIDLEPDVPSERASDVTVTGNTFYWVRFSLLSSGGVSANAGNVTFSNNSATGTFTCQPPIWVGPPAGVYRTGYTVSNNHLNPFGRMAVFVQTHQVVVDGNVSGGLYGNGGCSQDGGVVLLDSAGASVTNNDFGPTITTSIQADAASAGYVDVNNTP